MKIIKISVKEYICALFRVRIYKFQRKTLSRQDLRSIIKLIIIPESMAYYYRS